MHIQTITTPNGERLVVLPEAEFERMREAAEMAADVAAFDEAERRLPPASLSLFQSKSLNASWPAKIPSGSGANIAA